MRASGPLHPPQWTAELKLEPGSLGGGAGTVRPLGDLGPRNSQRGGGPRTGRTPIRSLSTSLGQVWGLETGARGRLRLPSNTELASVLCRKIWRSLSTNSLPGSESHWNLTTLRWAPWVATQSNGYMPVSSVTGLQCSPGWLCNSQPPPRPGGAPCPSSGEGG